MSTLLMVIHVTVAVILVISVLLQAGKGGGMGAAFGGGSSSSVFGAQGPATVMSRITTGAAIVFMVTSLSLSLFIKSDRNRQQSVMERLAVPAANGELSPAETTPPAPAGGETRAEPESAPEPLAPADQGAASSTGPAAVAGETANQPPEAAAPANEN